MQWKKLKNILLKTAIGCVVCGALGVAARNLPFLTQTQAEENVLATSALPFDQEPLLPSGTAEGAFSDTYAANQEKYLYSRIGLQKDGVSVRDITKGATEKHRSRVVVIDSGVKYDHEDFLAADGSIRFSPLSYNVTMKKTVAEAGYGILADSEIVNGHGTQVCGQIFAVGDNGVGIAGLAEDVELIFVKVTPTSEGGYDGYEMLEAMEYAATLNADVVNMSLGNFLTNNPYTTVLRRIRNSGAVIVSAAGNVSKSDLHYPSADNSVIGVGAFTSLLNYSESATEYPLASYSTFGDKNVQICAPGGFYTTKMDGGYAYGNGTSLATPIVTSAVALYRSLYPESTVEEVEAALFASANDQGDKGKDYKYGYGGLNVYDFLFGEKGTVTFDYGTGKTETRAICEGKALQEYPFPSVSDAPTGKEFGGWYLDVGRTRPLTYYKENLTDGATVYAKWQDVGADGLSRGEEQSVGALDYTFTTSGNIAIKGYYGGGERIILPNMLTVEGREYSVTEIAARAFQKHATLTKIVLPTTVTTVREYAFADDYEYVYLPSTVKKVEKHAFENAETVLYLPTEDGTESFTIGWNTNATLTTVSGVEQVTMQDGLELVLQNGAYTLLGYEGQEREIDLTAEYPIIEIAPQAFENNGYIQSVSAPDVATIGDRAFYGCAALTEVKMPKVETIGNSAFYSCGALTYLQFPKTLREIGDSAFAKNASLFRFAMPDGIVLEKIGDYAFEGCTSLEYIDCSNAQTLTYVGANAFFGAKNVFVAYLPDSVQTIGYNAFGGLQSLHAARLPFLGRGRTDTYTHFGYAFGASNIELQGSVVLENLQSLFIGGDVQDGALKGVSGLTIFAEGRCSVVDGCTVYEGGRYAFIRMYTDEILVGLLGGEEGVEVSAATLQSAFRMPQGYRATGWGADVSVFPATGEHVWTMTADMEEYAIVFQDETGKVLSEQTRVFGERPTEPTAPTKAATAQYEYVFTGWNAPVAPATENVVYTPVYQAVERSYVVSFYNGDELIAQAEYTYGATPLAPVLADRPLDETYYEKFIGWDQELSTVQGNAEYRACFEKTYVLYLVRFTYENGKTFCEQSYHYGETIVPPSTDRAPDEQYTYAFIGWQETFQPVTKAAEYTALYKKTLREYTVRFVDYDGTEISAERYTYGEMPTLPTAPERAEEDGFRFEFIGWDTDVSAVDGDKTYTATYKALSSKILVRFVNYDGTLLSETEYEKGATVVQPETPKRTVDSKSYYYEFSGWDRDVTAATENVTYKATFERKYYEYTVRFVDFDNSLIAEKTYRYGATVEIPNDPVRDGYTFVGWDKEITKVETDAVYKAVYEPIAGGDDSESDSSEEETSEIPDSSISSEISSEDSSEVSSETESSETESSDSAEESSSSASVSSLDSSSQTGAGSAKKGGCGGTVGAAHGGLLAVCALGVLAGIFLRKKERR